MQIKSIQAACAALLWLSIGQACGDEVRVLAAGASKAALERIAPEVTRLTGHLVRASYDTVGAQRDLVLAAKPGAAADLVILSQSAVEQLRTAGRLTGAPSQPIGIVAVSLATREGAALPDISTPQALQQALLAASSIAYADPARGATAGTHFDKVLDRLQLRATLQAKLTLLPFGVDVIKDVAIGKFALGVSQSSEILQHKGIAMVGPLPAPYGLSTAYAAALSSEQAAARQLLEHLASDSAMQHFRHSGFLPE